MVLVTPAQAVHEAGHAVVCAAKGFTYTMSMDAFGAYTTCHGEIQNNLFFKAFGGLLAALAFMAPVVIPKVRKTVWLFVPLITISVGHAVNAFVETVFYESYISGNPAWAGLLMASSYGTFAYMLIKYARASH